MKKIKFIGAVLGLLIFGFVMISCSQSIKPTVTTMNYSSSDFEFVAHVSDGNVSITKNISTDSDNENLIFINDIIDKSEISNALIFVSHKDGRHNTRSIDHVHFGPGDNHKHDYIPASSHITYSHMHGPGVNCKVSIYEYFCSCGKVKVLEMHSYDKHH